MTIGGSIALIVVGAILRFALNFSPAYVNMQLVGVILMIAGADRADHLSELLRPAPSHRGRP